jgi:hypothetical protein
LFWRTGRDRISCLCPLKIIIAPAQIKSKDLKTACVIKWKNLHNFIDWERLNIIKPNCLNVDKAIIFLKSVSNIAEKAEINIVRLEIKPIKKEIFSFLKIIEEKRIIRNTPAVTKVEEWTKAETGVGAAIAAGSHLLKGNWALLVKLLN